MKNKYKNRKFVCPECNSGNLTKVDQSKYPWIQKYHCDDCGKEFTVNSSSDTEDLSANG